MAKFLDETGLSTLITKIQEADATKQDKLVSGTNIKTINNYSLLGSGNLSISGGITELSTQYVRITDLSAGVYKLTYNGTKYLYYNGTSSTTTHTVTGGTGAVVLVVSKYSTNYWHWWYINGSTSYATLYFGYTTSSSGSTSSKSISSLYTGTPSNYYPIRSYTSGLQISSYSGSSNCQLYVPYATYSQYGVAKPAYSTSGTASLTTSSTSYSNSPTINARTTTAGKYYAVEIDSAGRLFVNVPWESGGGTVTDVQVNGTSVLSSGVANIVTETAYDASSNKIATMSDIPTGEVDVTINGTETSTIHTLTNMVVGSDTYVVPKLYQHNIYVTQTYAGSYPGGKIHFTIINNSATAITSASLLKAAMTQGKRIMASGTYGTSMVNKFQVHSVCLTSSESQTLTAYYYNTIPNGEQSLTVFSPGQSNVSLSDDVLELM